MQLGTYSVALMIGPPGAGKGTQARYVCDALRVPHVATGDLLREQFQRGTVLGIAARDYMERGDLVPDRLVMSMVTDRLERPDAERGALLDGFPRTVAQARALDLELDRRGDGVRAVFYLDVPLADLIGRLSGRRVCIGCHGTFHIDLEPLPMDGSCPRCGDRLAQRPDDYPEVISHRLAVYLEDSMPVLEHFDRRGLVHRIDGRQSIEAIRSALLATLEQIPDGALAE
jgi:adenylate kinase